METISPEARFSAEVARESLIAIKITPSMETISPEGRFSAEVARESLIAISQSVPETTPPADVPAKDSAVVNVVELNGCSSEEYRSKLISIAYSESPDVKTSPPSLVNPSA